MTHKQIRGCANCIYFELEGIEAVCTKRRIVLEKDKTCYFYTKNEDKNNDK